MISCLQRVWLTSGAGTEDLPGTPGQMPVQQALASLRAACPARRTVADLVNDAFNESQGLTASVNSSPTTRTSTPTQPQQAPPATMISRALDSNATSPTPVSTPNAAPRGSGHNTHGS